MPDTARKSPPWCDKHKGLPCHNNILAARAMLQSLKEAYETLPKGTPHYWPINLANPRQQIIQVLKGESK